MARLVFLDVDDTLLTPPYQAVRRILRLLGRQVPPEQDFLDRPHIDFHIAFPKLFKSAAEMWGLVLLSLPLGYFRSQKPLKFSVPAMASRLEDHRVYLVSRNPPSFTRWRVQRLKEIFGVNVGDRYIACAPLLGKGKSKLAIIKQIAHDRGVALTDCLLVDDSIENLMAVAADGVRCALVRSTWNKDGLQALRSVCPEVEVVNTEELPSAISAHLGGKVDPIAAPYFVVPPLSVSSGLRSGWTFLRRTWLYSEPLPFGRIIPLARHRATALLYRDPHAQCRRRMAQAIDDPRAGRCVLVLALKGGQRSSVVELDGLPLVAEMNDAQKIQALRRRCSELLKERGHRVPQDSQLLYREFSKTEENAKIRASTRLRQAKDAYGRREGVSSEVVERLAEQHIKEITTSSSYLNCLIGDWALHRIFKKVFRKIEFNTHPLIRSLEETHFIFYAASHRSYLDSGVLWYVLERHNKSFPYIVAADKMRKSWIGRLGMRVGTFFIKRRYVDEMYTAVMSEHVDGMQRPGASIEVFLEGQRSRSGLSLPPKKGMASIIWNNMDARSKVAIVPVSFTYNKIPESEKIIFERFDERKKLGLTTLREESDVKVRKNKRKSLYDKLRSMGRRYRSASVSDCYVNFGEPIIMDKASEQLDVQGYLNETMLRINGATAILPSSVLCLMVLGADERHTTSREAVRFLHFARSFINLYHLPEHLNTCHINADPLVDVQEFMKLPFVNRKFKRAQYLEREILCIEELDIDRANYYKNNVLHHFVLPAILSYVLQSTKQGHIEELHRCFGHMFVKLQTTYFLPKVKSSRSFIDGFMALMVTQGIVATHDNRWALTALDKTDTLLTVMSGLGAELIQGDLPQVLDAIRRSSRRQKVNIVSRLSGLTDVRIDSVTLMQKDAEGLYLLSDCAVMPGEQLVWSADDATLFLRATVIGTRDGSAELRPDAAVSAGDVDQQGALLALLPCAGTVTVKRPVSGYGVISNLSQMGAFVQTTLPLGYNDTLECSLGSSDDAHVVRGRVARVTQDGLGVAFQELSEESKARIVLLGIEAARAATHQTGQVAAGGRASVETDEG